MNPRLALLAPILLAACSGQGGSASSPPAKVIATLPIVNAGFEDAAGDSGVPGWTLTQHAGVAAYDMRIDTATQSAGKASFRIQRLKPQAFASVTQKVAVPPEYAGRTLQLSAMTRTENVGPEGWGITISIDGGRQMALEHGSVDWHRASVRMPVPQGAKEATIGALLLDDGTAWLDDVRLDVVETH